MKDVLFKAKSLLFNKWEYGYYYKHNDRHFIINENGRERMIDIKTLCQKTGLSDRNGKPIYEGDILKCTDWEGREYYRLLPVRYDELWCQFVLDDQLNKEMYNIWLDFRYFEIKGNIFDNKDLLEDF